MTGKCSACRNLQALPFDFTMAFQPILDLDSGRVFAHEALVRGLDGAGASTILCQVNETNRYTFDQLCRRKAIELAARLDIQDRISINFLPNAVYRAETCLRVTLDAAEEFGFPLERLVFEVTEGEKVVDQKHLASIISAYKKYGFLTAIDDFGAGYSGLNLLVEFQPDLIKLDMMLTRNIDQDRVRRSIISGILNVCQELKIEVIAEGVETAEEVKALRDLGISRFQGYYFAKPVFEGVAELTGSSWF